MRAAVRAPTYDARRAASTDRNWLFRGVRAWGHCHIEASIGLHSGTWVIALAKHDRAATATATGAANH